MTNNFQPSLAFVLRHECAYAPRHDGDLRYVIAENVPGDSGGCTKYGIDAADHPGIDIPNLTLDEATAIYRDGEWRQCQCDDLPRGVDTAVFDTAVNNGAHIAGLLLQRALGACGKPVATDGLIGKETVGAVAAVCSGSKCSLLDHLMELRRQHYANIVLLHPCEGQFLQGWLNRVNDLEQFLNNQTANTNTNESQAPPIQNTSLIDAATLKSPKGSADNRQGI